MCDEAEEAVRYAERIVWAAGWRIQEALVLQQLASTSGLARGRLEPRSDVIQLISYDGAHLGHIRRDGSSGPGERWVAVPKNSRRLPHGYDSAVRAARALAVAAGKMPPDADERHNLTK
jgi:hypothetical protein